MMKKKTKSAVFWGKSGNGKRKNYLKIFYI